MQEITTIEAIIAVIEKYQECYTINEDTCVIISDNVYIEHCKGLRYPKVCGVNVYSYSQAVHFYGIEQYKDNNDFILIADLYTFAAMNKYCEPNGKMNDEFMKLLQNPLFKIKT